MRIVMIGADYLGWVSRTRPLSLMKLAIEAKAPIRLAEALVDVNEKRQMAMARKIETACEGSVAGKRIAVLGLMDKPRTDDMRDAPSWVIVPELQAAGAHVVAYDPVCVGGGLGGEG